MEIITANNVFDEDQMHLDLMVLGVYVYHDPQMKGLLANEILDWEYDEPGFAVAKSHLAAQVFASAQAPRFANYYGHLEPRNPVIYCGADSGTRVWHTDLKEKISIQAICYQEDFEPSDGGSIRVKCHDGIIRCYYPKNGDVLVLNLKAGTEHIVDPITSDKKRIAINLKFM